MSEPVRATVALVAFFGAYFIGFLAYLVVGAVIDLDVSLESGRGSQGALVPIGLLWIIVGWTAARWWVLAIPVIPYAAYMLSSDVFYGPHAITLEELLATAVLTLAVGVAARAWVRT